MGLLSQRIDNNTDKEITNVEKVPIQKSKNTTDTQLVEEIESHPRKVTKLASRLTACSTKGEEIFDQQFKNDVNWISTQQGFLDCGGYFIRTAKRFFQEFQPANYIYPKGRRDQA